MKLTIFAATGGIGRHILEQAVAAGHDVTAVVRNPKKLSSEVRIVTADLAAPDPAALASAVEGADAVLSRPGSRSNAEAGVASQGRGPSSRRCRRRAPTHRRRQRRAICTVPSPGRPNPPKHDPGDGFFMRHLLTR